MAHSQEPESDQQSSRRSRWLAIGLASGSFALLVGAGIVWRGWVYARENLPPWLSQELSELLERPVEIGPLDYVSLSRAQFGVSTIPPIATDPSTLSLTSIEVQINPLDLLRRELPINMVLEQPEIYLVQTADRDWVTIDLNLPERPEDDRDPFIDVRLNNLRIQDGRLTLVPYRETADSPTPESTIPESTPPESLDAAAEAIVSGLGDRPQVELGDVQGQVQFSVVPLEVVAITGRPRETQQIDLDLSGTSVVGGSLQIKGAFQLPVADTPRDTLRDSPPSKNGAGGSPITGIQVLHRFKDWLTVGATPVWAQATQGDGQPFQAQLNLRAQQVRATDILPIVESFLAGPLPVQFPTGLVSGSVDINIDGDAPTTYTGTARVDEGTVVTPGLPEPLQELQGDVRFKGRDIVFEAVTAELGDLTAKAGGTLNLDRGYDFEGQVNPFTIAQISELFTVDLPVAAAGTFVADVTMTGPLNQPVVTTALTSQDPVTIDRVIFAEVQAQTTLQAPTLRIDSFQAIPQDGGAIAGQGQFTFGRAGQPGQLALAVTGDRLPGDALGQLYGLPDTVALGPVFIEADLAGPLDQLTGNARWRAPLGTYPAQGTLALANNTLRFTDTFVQVAGGTVAGSGTLALANRRWESTLRATGLQLNQLGLGVDGTVRGEAQLAGRLDASGLGGIQGQGMAQAAVAGGFVNSRVNLNQGQWIAAVQGDELQMAAFSPNLQGTGNGTFQFRGTTETLSLAGVRGEGQLVLSDGLATAAPLAPQLAAIRAPLTADLTWNGQVIGVQQASSAGLQANGTLTPILSGPAAPGLANVDLNLTADNVTLAALPIANQWVAVGGTGSFDGRLVGSPSTLALNGTARLDNLALSDLAFATPLTGPISFSRADGGLTIDLREPSQLATGDRIYVSTQAGDRDLVFEVRSGDSLAEGYTQGDTFLAEIRQLPLDRLRLPQAGLEGIGMVSGTVESATIAGNWREPNLRASFDIVDPGLGYISLRTADDPGIPTDPNDPTAPFDPTQPLTETIRYGRLRGTLGYANNTVSLVGVRVESATGQSRYMLSGNYALDGSRQINGELVVDNGQIQDILLTLKIFELSDFRVNLLQPPEWYRPVTAAEIAALQTNQVGDRNATLLDQLRRFAEVQELQDILAAEAEAALLPPLEGLEGSFSGTVTAQGALPQAVQVDVDLVGTNWVWRDPDYPTGIAYRFDEIIAQGSYQDEVIRLNPVQIRTNFPTADPSAPTLAVAELNGEFSLNEDDPIDRTLRLNMADLPIEAVRRPLRIPNNFDGYINAAAALTGTLNDPQVRGRLGVNNAAINGQPIDLAAADFLYREARLNLRGNVAIEDQVDPLTLVATVPLPLAGSDQIPASDEVTVRLRVRDDGFALVNLLTQAVTWETGQAEMAINVDGRWPIDKPFEEALTSLIVTGAARFDDVTLSSRNLPEPLTNIQGDIVVVEGRGNGSNDSVYFNGLVLDFQNLTGNFSDGQVLAEGQLKVVPSINDLFPGVGFEAETSPLPTEADPSPLNPPDDRFRLTLDNIALDLRNPAGTYNGRLDGVVVVGGSLYLLEPLLYGDIRLSNGVITLPETRDDNGFAAGGGFSNASPSVYQPLPPVLEDFSVTLADNVRLAIPGLVNVTAEGTLALVGTVPDIRPDGRINLPSGRINLLTTEFRFTGNENYAEFSAQDERIDPYLVANLSAAVSDTVGGSTSLITASPFPRNEISDAAINQLGLTQSGIQTVRIRASVDGRASRVIQLQGVELESTPPRSENEIITLISSEFLTALESTLGSVSGGGDSFQGLIAFAGSALLNRLQGILGAGLDNADLRLFSASPAGSQQVDVGAEVGFNFSPNVSVSVQKVFTNITPALFSVRYRINDQFTIRAITSYEQFNENTGAILEFRL